MKKHCFIHSGKGRSLCAMHRRAVSKLATKWNIDRETAVFALRDFEHDVEDARAARVRELETAIRAIREHRALVASRSVGRSRRKRARG